MSCFMSSSYAWLFTELDDVLGRVQRLKQSSSRAVPQLVETTDTNGDEFEGSERRRRVRSKWT